MNDSKRNYIFLGCVLLLLTILTIYATRDREEEEKEIRAIGRAIGEAIDKTVERAVEKAVQRAVEKAVQRAVEKALESLPEKETEPSGEIIQTPVAAADPKRPKAPKNFQTFIFTIQVVLVERQDGAYAKKQLKLVCGTMKLVAGVKKAIPGKLYGVYLHEGKAYMEPLD